MIKLAIILQRMWLELINGTVFLLTLMDLELALKIVLLCVTIFYTVVKIVKGIKSTPEQ